MSARADHASAPHARTGPGALGALRKSAPIVLFAALPASVVLAMFVVAVVSGPLALDFRQELYPQGQDLLAGRNPYPHGLWPPVAVAVIAPLTVLPSAAAGVAIGVLGLACMGAALWLVGMRDWRVYGIVGLWPPVTADIRIAHLTPALCLLAALAWRYRDRPTCAGCCLGLAGGLKFFLWPLGLWLLATGRVRAAVVGAAVALGSLLLVIPFMPLDDYLRTLHDVSRRFDQDSYSPFGLLTQLGWTEWAAHATTYALGAAALFGTWRRRSFVLAITAALVLSPIVWLDFYALAAIPLAVARPRLSFVWLTPLVTWGLPSSGIATDPAWGVGRVLVVFTLVLVVAARSEPR